MRIPSIVLITLISMLSFVCSAADQANDARPCDDMSAFEETAIPKLEMLKLLRERKFKEIQGEFKVLYQCVVGNGVREMSVYELLNFVESGDPVFEPLLNEWVRSSPDSVWPLLVRGKYWKALGWKKRGNKFVGETTPEQFESLDAELQKAAQDLEQAIKIDATNVMTFATYLGAAKASNGRRTARELLKMANKIAPKNFVTRFVAMDALSPRWGGSFEEMDAIVEGAKSADMNKLDITRLNYLLEREKGSHYQRVEKNTALALEHYALAVKICDGRGAWNSIVKTHSEIKNWPAVESSATQLIRVWPEHVYAYEQRAWAREQLGRVREAIPDYERAASGGSAWAQNRLAVQYIEGKNVPIDLIKARALLEQAAAKGSKNAKENLDKLIKQQLQK